MKHFPTRYNQTKTTTIRRTLRQNANVAEEILWKFLRGSQLGYKFRWQFDIHSFIVDFYCHQLQLVIELDGWTHEYEKTKQHDGIKQRVLEQAGCKVIRITNEQVYGDIAKLLEYIENICKSREKEL